MSTADVADPAIPVVDVSDVDVHTRELVDAVGKWWGFVFVKKNGLDLRTDVIARLSGQITLQLLHGCKNAFRNFFKLSLEVKTKRAIGKQRVCSQAHDL